MHRSLTERTHTGTPSVYGYVVLLINIDGVVSVVLLLVCVRDFACKRRMRVYIDSACVRKLKIL